MKLNIIFGMIVIVFLLLNNISDINGQANLNLDGHDPDRPRTIGPTGFMLETNDAKPIPENIGGTMVINEFMPDPASDWDGDMAFHSAGDEWVELFNFGSVPVNIGGWNISDSSQKRYGFPPGLTIPTGGHYVAFGSNHSLSLNNNGDTIRLLNATDIEIDNYVYTSCYDDISMGRLPDGASNRTEFNEPTPGRSNGPIPKIVINEVMYDPAGSDTENEWLEVFNNDSRAINITYWELTDQDGDVDFVFRTAELPYMVLPPQKYLVLHSSLGNDDLDFGDGVGDILDKTINKYGNIFVSNSRKKDDDVRGFPAIVVIRNKED